MGPTGGAAAAPQQPAGRPPRRDCRPAAQSVSRLHAPWPSSLNTSSRFSSFSFLPRRRFLPPLPLFLGCTGRPEEGAPEGARGRRQRLPSLGGGGRGAAAATGARPAGRKRGRAAAAARAVRRRPAAAARGRRRRLIRLGARPAPSSPRARAAVGRGRCPAVCTLPRRCVRGCRGTAPALLLKLTLTSGSQGTAAP